PSSCSTLFPYTTLFRSSLPAARVRRRAVLRLEWAPSRRRLADGRHAGGHGGARERDRRRPLPAPAGARRRALLHVGVLLRVADRSEEHTSELQSPCNLV